MSTNPPLPRPPPPHDADTDTDTRPHPMLKRQSLHVSTNRVRLPHLQHSVVAGKVLIRKSAIGTSSVASTEGSAPGAGTSLTAHFFMISHPFDEMVSSSGFVGSSPLSHQHEIPSRLNTRKNNGEFCV